MGTGLWGVAAPQPVELVQEFIPEEGVGPVRDIDYDHLNVGRFDTTDRSTFPDGELGVVIREMEEAVHRESLRPGNNFFEGSIVIEIEPWQADLKRLTMTVHWLEIPEGSSDNIAQQRDFVKTFFLHRGSNYQLLE
jgi:hypothetical protein